MDRWTPCTAPRRFGVTASRRSCSCISITLTMRGTVKVGGRRLTSAPSEEADRLLGRMVAAIDEAKLTAETMVLVTADHGGVDKGHGGSTMVEIEIPWIAVGPGVHAGVELDQPINTYDTAPTVLKALGATAPSCWIGRPVEAAFE